MSVLFRLQDNVPEAYCDESRDFQLLCRLYDCIINGVKYDVDSTSYLTDTENCKSNILSLLQTKLGFFSNLKYNDDDLRYILQAFPDIIKYKGSILAIREAVNVYLKLNHITSNIRIWYVSDSSVVYGTEVSDHTIILGVNTALKNIQVLDEIIKFVLPTGFGFFFYFYTSIDVNDEIELANKAELIFSSDNLASNIRGSVDAYGEKTFKDRIIGSIDETFIASDDSIIPTINGTYNAGDSSLFIGMYNSIADRPSSAVTGSYCIVKNIDQEDPTREYWQAYIYNSSWEEVNFKGQVNTLPSTSSSKKNDIVGISSNNIYYFYYDSTWNKLNFRGYYSSEGKVVGPKNFDCIRLPDDIYEVRIGSKWVKATSIENYSTLNKASASDYAIALINGVTYYMFDGNSWVDNTLAIYTLVDKVSKEEGYE